MSQAAHAFQWDNPYPGHRAPIFARNVVASSQPLASGAGLRILAAGGNAIDAAIAAAAVLVLTEPCSNGLGSDLFAQVWHGNKLHALNASGTAPSAWTPTYFAQRYGADAQRTRPERGWDTVTVPGVVAGWVALHEAFGSLPFADLLQPAIELAETGFRLSPITQDKWAKGAQILSGYPGFAEHFMPHGRVPGVGEHILTPGLARALRAIALTRGEAFYHGEIAQELVRFSQRTGGSIQLPDLAAYRPLWVEPIQRAFHGYEVHECPPNGQGLAALMCLGMLQHTELASLNPNDPMWWHLGIEAMKLAFADVYAQVSDPASMRVSTEAMLDDTYLRERATQISRTQATAFKPGLVAPKGGTVYLSCADAQGNMISLIQSNYMGFGSGLVLPGWGVSLQNRGHGFSLNPQHPNVVAPGKRPFHTIIPGFLTQGGRPQMSFGVMGGNMQPQGHVQTLCRMLVASEQPQTACDAPRWKWNQGLEVELEPHTPLHCAQALSELGHQVVTGNDSYMDFGSGQFIWSLGDPARDGYVAASDTRRDGLAAGF